MEASRVEDYLNDKVQTFADFETLDHLLASVKLQQDLLKKQLEATETQLRDDQTASIACALQARQKAELFEKRQSDVDRRLLVITESDAVEDATHRFEPHMAKLHNLELANQYAGLLEEIERLRISALEKRTSASDLALSSFHQLQSLCSRLQPLQQAADGAAPHLVYHTRSLALEVRASLRDTFAAELNTILEKILWPKKSAALPSSLAESFNAAVGKLLLLQKPELEELAESAVYKSEYQPLPILLPLEVMIEPLAARFKFHFGGDRPTNRLDKPEFFLNNFLEILETHVQFINDYLQPVFFTHFRESTLFNSGNTLDATSAFLTALLPILRSKVSSVLSQVADQPRHMSHLIHELMLFDTTIRGDWHYDGAFGKDGLIWGGICWEALTAQGWFDHWLEVESDFALARYQTIVDDTSALNLDYDSVASTATKPTSAAIRVHDLIITITNTYKPLTSLSQKLRFLMDIQITILDRFHDRLREALHVFESKTSAVGRTVQGVSAAELADLQGLSGLDRLCRIFGSADYLEKAMRDWSDDIFFLDLWDQLQTRVQQKEQGMPVAGTLGVADIAAKTSASLTTGDGADVVASGALFDETAASYAALRDRAEGLLVMTLRRGLTDSLNPFLRHASFAATSEDALAQHDLTPTSTLVPALTSLQEGVDFLAKALSSLAMRRVSRSVAGILDDLVFNRVILTKDFSLQGARQFACDLAALSGALSVDFAPDRSAPRLRRSYDALKLLSLDSGEGAAFETKENEGDAMTLWTVEKSIFASNEEARTALADLELTALSESEARKIMKCRVELSG